MCPPWPLVARSMELAALVAAAALGAPTLKLELAEVRSKREARLASVAAEAKGPRFDAEAKRPAKQVAQLPMQAAHLEP